MKISEGHSHFTYHKGIKSEIKLVLALTYCRIGKIMMGIMLWINASSEHIPTDIRDQLHCLRVQQRTEYKTCVIRQSHTSLQSVRVYKCLHKMAPAYFAEMCTQFSATVEWRHLRSSAHGDLVVSRCRTTERQDTAREVFLHPVPVLWNSLPQTVRDPCLSLTQFGSRLKNFIFCRVYGTIS